MLSFVTQPTTIAALLRDLMVRKKLSQRSMAKWMGVSPAGLNKWIHGSRPDYASCARIADYAGWPQEQVLRMAGYAVEGDPPNVPELRNDVLRLAVMIQALPAWQLDAVEAVVRGLRGLPPEQDSGAPS